jgi:Integrase core domain.
VATTDSQHGFTIYPNLAQYVRVSGTNQLWVADITYLRLGREFVYLAVVLDVYSRRVVGWELGRSLNTALPLAALNKAIASRQPAPGLVHHSDRGTQYASEEFENAATQQPGTLPLALSRDEFPAEPASASSATLILKRKLTRWLGCF